MICSKVHRREAQRPAVGVCQETGSHWQLDASRFRFPSQEPMNCDAQLKQCIAECRRVLEARRKGAGFWGLLRASASESLTRRPRQLSAAAPAKSLEPRAV